MHKALLSLWCTDLLEFPTGSFSGLPVIQEERLTDLNETDR